ncbi:MAG: Dabb family protein [Lachnospiraceae bacterium]|nr:Dabb family protein [Lachnospiraceae bacterium]
MIKHVILWQLKDELTEEEKGKVKAEIKSGLEGLAGKIPGLLEIKVQAEGLASSNADLMLDSSFEDEASLQGYAVHPLHVAVADAKVRPYTKSRTCLDYKA